MMKKRILSLAVTAGLVGAASAAQAQMHINDKGLGEALIYPFYSAANGNDTYVHVVNTTSDTKAVKVRFIEAMNSQEVLDFNLYLSPEDVWAGVITKNPNGDGAIIRTVDTSCTVPELGTAGGANVGPLAGTTTTQADGKVRRDQPFVNFKYDLGAGPGDVVAEADRSIERTLEGYIEIIEMGQLNPTGTPTGTNFGAMAVHDAQGVPANCVGLREAWSTGGAWLSSESAGFLDWDGNNSAGGLYGYGVVINVEKGTAVGFDAVAIDDFVATEGPGAGTLLHRAPGDDRPSLADASTEAVIFDGVTPVSMSFGSPADAVSGLLMSQKIMNDYVIDSAINATTDWVVTMPTKRFYVDLGPAYTDPALAPFANRWNPATSSACEPIAIQTWDREEAFVDISTGPVFSPQPTTPTSPDLEICREVSVISFGGEESALNASSRVLYGFDPGYNEGWASLSFDPSDLNGEAALLGKQPAARTVAFNDGDALVGLPVAGFAVFSYQNGNLGGGVLANYSAASVHKSAILITEAPEVEEPGEGEEGEGGEEP